MLEKMALSGVSTCLAEASFVFFAEKRNCSLIANSLENLNFKQGMPSVSLEDLAIIQMGFPGFFFTPTDAYLQQLKEALKIAATPTVLSCVLPKIHIVILPAQAMKNCIKDREVMGVYIPNYFLILLQEDLFKKDAQHQQQLVGHLRNELSHASVHLTQKGIYGNNEKLFGVLKPWGNDTQKQQLIKAYALFEARIERHRELSEKSHKHLSHKEHKELLQYRRALDSFEPKRLGSKGHNIMQVFIQEDKKTHKINIYKNLASKAPPRGKIKQRRRYMETAFFREKDQFDIHGQFVDGIYASTGNADQDLFKLWADKISDFDQLPAVVQRTYGIELCDYLQDFHQFPSHCDYSFSL